MNVYLVWCNERYDDGKSLVNVFHRKADAEGLIKLLESEVDDYAEFYTLTEEFVIE